MMFKISEHFKVIGKGTSLKAGPGEFIFYPPLPKATLLEVAKANGIKIQNKKATEDELFKIIEDSFNSNEAIPNMNDEVKNKESTKKAIDQKFLDIIKAGFEANKDADTIQVELVKAGLKLKQALAVFKEGSESLGFKTSSKDRTEAITKLLDGFVPTTHEEVEKTTKHIMENVKDTNEAQAHAVLRTLCKKAEKEFPKKPKGAAKDGKARGFKAEAQNWILANKNATKKDLEKFLADNKQRPVFVSYYWNMIELCRKYAGQSA